MITYKDYWWDRLLAYKNAGLLRKSGVSCPQCANELWTTLPENHSKLVDVIGNKPNLQFVMYFSVCINGHRYDL